MKITKKTLKRLIREELESELAAGQGPRDPDFWSREAEKGFDDDEVEPTWRTPFERELESLIQNEEVQAAHDAFVNARKEYRKFKGDKQPTRDAYKEYDNARNVAIAKLEAELSEKYVGETIKYGKSDVLVEKIWVEKIEDWERTPGYSIMGNLRYEGRKRPEGWIELATLFLD